MVLELRKRIGGGREGRPGFSGAFCPGGALDYVL